MTADTQTIQNIKQALTQKKCEICNAKPTQNNKWRLQTHHIDHTRATTAKDLIIIVCPACHMRAHQYLATDWRWLLDPPRAITARVLAWYAAKCGTDITPAQAQQRQNELQTIMRARLNQVFDPL